MDSIKVRSLIAFGGITALVVLVALLICCLKKCKGSDQRSEAPPTAATGEPDPLISIGLMPRLVVGHIQSTSV